MEVGRARVAESLLGASTRAPTRVSIAVLLLSLERAHDLFEDVPSEVPRPNRHPPAAGQRQRERADELNCGPPVHVICNVELGQVQVLPHKVPSCPAALEMIYEEHFVVHGHHVLVCGRSCSKRRTIERVAAHPLSAEGVLNAGRHGELRPRAQTRPGTRLQRQRVVCALFERLSQRAHGFEALVGGVFGVLRNVVERKLVRSQGHQKVHRIVDEVVDFLARLRRNNVPMHEYSIVKLHVGHTECQRGRVPLGTRSRGAVVV